MKALQNLFARDRRAGDLIFAVAFLAIAVFLAAALPWQAPFVDSTKLTAQPAFWPVVGVGMMVVFGAVHLFGALSSPRKPGRLQEAWLWFRSLEFVGWFYAYVVVIPLLGYLPTTVLFVPLLSFRLGYRSAKVFVSGLIFAVAVVLIFKTGLGVALPSGKIYSLLPDAARNFFIVNF